MSRVIAVVNQKGGVAKTTTVANLGVALAQAGQRCLLVDSDPQGSLAISLGQDPDSLASHTLYEAMVLADEGAHKDLKDVILHDQQGVDLIPANLELAAAEIDLNSQYAREYALSRLLAPVRDAYDFILVDCPPQLGILTINALVAADSVLVPLATNYLALRGLQLLLRTVRLVQSRLNASLRIEGLLPTLYDRRTSHHQETLQEVRRIFGEQHIRVFETVIPRSVRFEESPITGTPAVVYAPNTPGAQAYRELVQEVLINA
ncbi:ParA family protein [Sulfobacillus harzensis]|uniref:Sporulation initiation inhibitor protein Soj n=1 Tax=Sulfobacillus harzensis TaxID=2729629 RepID=A0A7Y0L7Y1_9FIRM|nr:ParA family protein [Sulfobacillus harzensis]NMP24846.1 ParA family protein [Sulfobacillus harzensis]